MRIQNKPITTPEDMEPGVPLFASDVLRARWGRRGVQNKRGTRQARAVFGTSTFGTLDIPKDAIRNAVFQKYAKSNARCEELVATAHARRRQLEFVQARTSKQQLAQLSDEEFAEEFRYWHTKYFQCVRAAATIQLACEGASDWIIERLEKKCTTVKQHESAVDVLTTPSSRRNAWQEEALNAYTKHSGAALQAALREIGATNPGALNSLLGEKAASPKNLTTWIASYASSKKEAQAAIKQQGEEQKQRQKKKGYYIKKLALSTVEVSVIERMEQCRSECADYSTFMMQEISVYNIFVSEAARRVNMKPKELYGFTSSELRALLEGQDVPQVASRRRIIPLSEL